MKEFGNIVCDGTSAKPYLRLRKYSDVSEIEDRSLPTIVVGWNKAKENIKEVNILQKWYPEQNIGWTFSRTERGSDHQRDMTTFCDNLLKNVVSPSTYRQVDVMRMSFNEVRKFIQFIDSPLPKYVFIDRGQFMFVYSIRHKRTYGISLSTCRYCGINIDRLIKRVFSNPANQKVNNLSPIPYNLKSKLGDSLHLYFPLLEYFV